MSPLTTFLHDDDLPYRRAAGQFTNRELATIAVLAALHFAASLAARLAGGMLHVFLGPWAVFVDGIGGEGIPCLLLAVTVTLIPRVGTAAATILTVWLLNSIVSGAFSVVATQQVSVSIVVHEVVLALLFVTIRPARGGTGRLAAASETLRTSAAIGAANSLTLYAQFYIAIHQYKLSFDETYIHQVALITGLGYGAGGAAVGAVWGRRLRRTAP